MRETREKGNRKRRDQTTERMERARSEIKDGGNLIEIVPIITHSGAAEV